MMSVGNFYLKFLEPSLGKMARGRRKHFLLFGLIVLVNLWVYSPGFYHVPRADHLFYLADMAGKNDWWTLAIKSFDFSRSRRFAPGDGIIFRPGAVFLLGSQKAFFGYDFFWWQVTGLVLHLTVVACLYRFLYLIRPGMGAFWLSAFFSLMFMNMDLVSWHHITSILLSLIMVMIALIQWQHYRNSRERPLWRIGIMTLCMTAACFTYEIHCIYSAILFLFLLSDEIKRRKGIGRSALLLLAPACFGLVSYLNRRMLGQTVEDSNVFWSGTSVFDKVLYTFKALFWWIYAGMFPGEYKIVYSLGRAGIDHPEQLFKPLPLTHFPVLLAMGCIAVYVVVFFYSASRDFIRRRAGLTGLMAAFLFSWSALIVVYRVQNRGVEFALAGSVYYLYMVWLFFIILVHNSINYDRIHHLRHFRHLRHGALAMLTALIFVNAVMTYRGNAALAREHEPSRKLIAALESLIRDVGDEPGFSFFVDPEFPGNYVYPYRLKKDDPLFKLYSYVELLYLDRFDNETPRFVFISAKRNQGKPAVFRTKW